MLRCFIDDTQNERNEKYWKVLQVKDKITLFQYSVYLTPHNTVEVESSILEQEDWDMAMEDFEEYQWSYYLLLIRKFFLYVLYFL
jgi:hypothetical protein